MPTDFIEQYFLTLSGPFAFWFFSQVLSDGYTSGVLNGKLVPIVSSWGPDLMWCGAAKDWLEMSTGIWEGGEPCMLSMMNMEHKDTRQIDHKEENSLTKAESKAIDLLPVEKYATNALFSSWIDFSAPFRELFGGRKDKTLRDFLDTLVFEDKEAERQWRT